MIKQLHATLVDAISLSLPDQRNPLTIALMFLMQALSNIQHATECHMVSSKIWLTMTTYMQGKALLMPIAEAFFEFFPSPAQAAGFLVS